VDSNHFWLGLTARPLIMVALIGAIPTGGGAGVIDQ
jgi:hypothetical protein